VQLKPTDAARCRQLAEVFTEQFAPPGTPASPEDVAANFDGIAHADATVLAAFVGDRCAGGGFLDVAEGAASLWGAAVAPEFRRRGIQRALMERRLAMARERAATLAYIETASGGPTHRNAARLGFRLAYTRVLMMRPRG
jgi:GNAT superfamily N-acetyltransferase